MIHVSTKKRSYSYHLYFCTKRYFNSNYFNIWLHVHTLFEIIGKMWHFIHFASKTKISSSKTDRKNFYLPCECFYGFFANNNNFLVDWMAIFETHLMNICASIRPFWMQLSWGRLVLFSQQCGSSTFILSDNIMNLS